MQWLGVFRTTIGFAPRDAVTLEVRGRKSGKARRTPVIRLNHDDNQYVVALAGESSWVRNVRCAGGAAVIKRRGSTAVRLVELPVPERAPITKLGTTSVWTQNQRSKR
jgi:deazaflavin-dependent oxidoreductase (nitroreductase family)